MQSERYTICDEYTILNIKQLQEKFGHKYSFNIYKDVDNTNMELHEKPLSMQIRLKIRQCSAEYKRRNHKQER